MVVDLCNEFPLEALHELSEDVEALREACVSTVTARRADFLGRLAPMELRVPAGHYPGGPG
jgi:hypothetical protein